MGLKEIFRKANGGTPQFYAQSAGGAVMTRVEPCQPGAQKLPNAIRVVEDKPAAAAAAAKPDTAAVAEIKAVEQKTQAAPAPAAKRLAVTVTRERIAERAWEIWEREGRPSGRAMDHWLRAERELRG